MERVSRNRYDGIDPFTVRQARGTANRLIGGYGFVSSDLEDLEQGLVVAGLRGAAGKDGNRELQKMWIKAAIRNQTRNLIAERRAACRDHQEVAYSLNERIEINKEGETIEREESLDAENYPSLTPSDPDPRRDLHAVVSRLRPEQAKLCCLLASETATRAAATLGIARSTLYRWKTEIRESFTAAGLRIYIDQQ